MAISNAIMSSATCWLTRLPMNLETARQIGLSLRLKALLNCENDKAIPQVTWDIAHNCAFTSATLPQYTSRSDGKKAICMSVGTMPCMALRTAMQDKAAKANATSSLHCS